MSNSCILLPTGARFILEYLFNQLEIWYPICVHWQRGERRDADVFQIPCVLVSAGLVVAELSNDELSPVIREKLEQVANGANTAVRVFRGVEVFGLYVNSDDAFVNLESEIENRATPRQVHRHEPASRTNVSPVLLDAMLNHRAERAGVLTRRHPGTEFLKQLGKLGFEFL